MIDHQDWKIAAGFDEVSEEDKAEFERFLDDTYAEWMYRRGVEEFGPQGREDF